LTVLATAVLGKRNFCFFAFLSRSVEFAINHIGKLFAAFHDIFRSVETLQTRCFSAVSSTKFLQRLLEVVTDLANVEM